MRCMYCGGELPDDSLFCTYCGNKLYDEQQRKAELERKAKEKKRLEKEEYKKRKAEEYKAAGGIKGDINRHSKLIIACASVVILICLIVLGANIAAGMKKRSIDKAASTLLEALKSDSESKLTKVIFPKDLSEAGVGKLKELGVDFKESFVLQGGSAKEIEVLGKGESLKLEPVESILKDGGAINNGQVYEMSLIDTKVSYEDGSEKRLKMLAYQIDDYWYIVPGAYEAYIKEKYENSQRARILGLVSDAVLSQKNIWDEVLDRHADKKSLSYDNAMLPTSFEQRVTEILGSFPKFTSVWSECEVELRFADKGLKVDINGTEVYPFVEDDEAYYKGISSEELEMITAKVDISRFSLDSYNAPELEYAKLLERLDADVRWALTPFLDAEDMLVADISKEDTEYEKRPDNVAYVMVDGKWGFIGYDGEYYVEPAYSAIGRYGFQYILTNDSGESAVHLASDLSVDQDGNAEGFGGPGLVGYYYIPDNRMTVEKWDVDEMSQIYVMDASAIVQEGYYSTLEGTIKKSTDGYGLAGKRGLLVKTEYEGAYGHDGNYGEDPLYYAFKSNGKWAFLKQRKAAYRL